jgi:hypothetical protein
MITAYILLGAFTVVGVAAILIPASMRFRYQRIDDDPWTSARVLWPRRIGGRWRWLVRAERRMTWLSHDGLGLFTIEDEWRL